MHSTSARGHSRLKLVAICATSIIQDRNPKDPGIVRFTRKGLALDPRHVQSHWVAALYALETENYSAQLRHSGHVLAADFDLRLTLGRVLSAFIEGQLLLADRDLWMLNQKTTEAETEQSIRVLFKVIECWKDLKSCADISPGPEKSLPASGGVPAIVRGFTDFLVNFSRGLGAWAHGQN